MITPTLTEYLVRLFQCEEGQPEISAIFFLGVRFQIIEVQIDQGESRSLDLPFRRILERSRQLCSKQLLLLHTHPSGDPRPSLSDIVATRRICLDLRRQGRRLMDHIILTKDHYFSFRGHGMM